MLPIERLDKIQSILQVQKTLKIEDLVQEFGVSDMTIRRDIEKLEQMGVAQRCYGGITQRTGITLDLNYKEREVLNLDAKREIAQYCFDHFIPGNDVIYLDAGSTVLSLAKLLVSHHCDGLTVATNDIIIANELVNASINLIMLGGQVQRGLGCIHGYTAEGQLTELRIGSAFVSGLALNEDYDLFAATEPKVYFRRKLLEKCSNAYLMMDSSKMYKQSIFRTHNASAYTAVISDRVLSEDEKLQVKNKGIVWLSTHSEERA